MQFITFYTPAQAPTPGAMPDPKHLEEMGKMMAEMTAKGVLVANGAVMRAAGGAQVTLNNGDFEIRDGADQVLAAKVIGFAILQSENKETLMSEVRYFMEVAGDGTVDVFPLMGPPPQQ
jgi:hypothetical protein